MVPSRALSSFFLGFLIFLTAACSASNAQLDDLRRQAEDAARDASAQIDNLRDDGGSKPGDEISNGDDETDAGSSKNDDGGGGGGGGGGPKSDAGSDSGTTCPPVGQVFTSVEGPFCPFQQGGVFDHCAVGEHCCHYPIESGLSATCNAGAVACAPAIANGFDWRCDETNDCPGATVCCFAGSITPIPQCPGTYSHVGSSTACRSSCTAGTEMQTCGSQADCPIGKTCTGVRIRGKHIGLCR